MQNNDFPRMLYRAGGPEEIHGGHFHTKIVNDQDEQDAALADGWHVTTPEALKAAKPAARGGAGGDGPNPDHDAPPTRDELKQKATELGLTFKHNVSNAALAELIAAELAKG